MHCFRKFIHCSLCLLFFLCILKIRHDSAFLLNTCKRKLNFVLQLNWSQSGDKNIIKIIFGEMWKWKKNFKTKFKFSYLVSQNNNNKYWKVNNIYILITRYQRICVYLNLQRHQNNFSRAVTVLLFLILSWQDQTLWIEVTGKLKYCINIQKFNILTWYW